MRDSSNPESSQARENTICVRELSVGESLRCDIVDAKGVLLLKAGFPVTDRLISHLRRRGISKVRRQPAQTERKRARLSSIDEAAADETARRLDDNLDSGPFEKTAFAQPPSDSRERVPLSEIRHQIQAGLRVHEHSVGQLAQLTDAILGGQACATAIPNTICDQLLNVIHRDDGLAMLALQLRHDDSPEYLFAHAVNVSLLSMNVADYLGFGRDEVIDLGIGALLHDVGMLRVPDSIRLAPRRLTGEERMIVERHPIHAANALESMDASQRSVIVAYQMHERCDGSGYPRQRTQRHIHPLARIASAADAFNAWSGWRPHRVALTPYKALERIVRDAAAGLFDRDVVRAILDCLSLFPIGSRVELSNQTTARVIRSNGAQHTRPVVERLTVAGEETGEFVDLAKTDACRVVKVLDDDSGSVSVSNAA